MSHPLIGRNPDLQRLRDEDFHLEISNGYVIVHVPYVDSNASLQIGALAYPYTEAGGIVGKPNDHTCYWVGKPPCQRDGALMVGIKASDCAVQLRPGMTATIHLSNKPQVAAGTSYVEPDFYVKFKRYIKVICPAAESKDPNIRAAMLRPVPITDDESPFQYADTASSRAGINAVSQKFRSQTVAIIGLGGTGSYVLDLVAKCAVKEIRLFDDDALYSHNAFRAPGAASLDDLNKRQSKVAYYASTYSKLHKHITPHEVRVDATNMRLFEGVTFAFVCVDNGEARRVIMGQLQARRIPFIDVGMGVSLVAEEASLVGVVRVTTSSSAKNDHLLSGKRVPIAPAAEDDAYRQNIQIADLNALNAAFAVIKWKKLVGVYQDHEREHHSTYTVNCNLLTSDELAAPV